MHLPDFIRDLSYILIAAACVVIIFKKLKQPMVLGYIVAGFLVGPHFPFAPSISDTKGVEIWAEIGVIFLLFSLGLEFSFKKLFKVGASATTIAMFEVMFLLGVGYFAGHFLGWSKIDSLFLGGILAISSTTIIIKAFNDLGFKGKKFISLVFGVLIVEDIFAILLMVLLSTIAITNVFSGMELVYSSARLLFYLVIWFVLGIFFIPLILKKVRNLLNAETTLVFALGLCLLMVVIATDSGFSPALGAFVMGSILAETPEGSKIEHIIMPVRDLFAAIFFVSVGMLLDLDIIISQFNVIVLLTVLTIVGKILSTTAGALLSGQRLKVSIQTGFSLAQIGEFSFIIATLGLTLGVTSDFLYPIAVSVSAITTLTTPYLIKVADPFSDWLEKNLPNNIKSTLQNYHLALKGRDHKISAYKPLFFSQGIRLAANFIFIWAILLIIDKLFRHYHVLGALSDFWLSMVLGLIAILVTSPFFCGIIFGDRIYISSIKNFEVSKLNFLKLGIVIVQYFLALGLYVYLLSMFVVHESFSYILFLVFLVFSFFVIRLARPLYYRFEKSFLVNFRAEDVQSDDEDSRLYKLLPWDASLVELRINADSEYVSKTIQQTGMREKYGVIIAIIERGSKTIFAPSGSEVLLPSDVLFVVGEEDQVDRVREIVEYKGSEELSTLSKFNLDYIPVRENSAFVNKSILNSGIRDLISGLVVGIESGTQRLLSPNANQILKAGDLIWVVGDQQLINKLK